MGWEQGPNTFGISRGIKVMSKRVLEDSLALECAFEEEARV